MNGLQIMLKREPAVIGTTVAAIMPVLILFGVNPKIGGAIATAFTVLIGLWIRSKVYTEETVTNRVEQAATSVAGQLGPDSIGPPGIIPQASQTVVDDVVAGVMAQAPG